jgi:hypothetical protein
MSSTHHLPSSLLMVRPAAFGYNPQTATSNAFQQPMEGADVAALALEEFDRMVTSLQAHDISVQVVEDLPQPMTPDAVFPNNWFTTHGDGTVALYPMMSEIRRLERRTDILEDLKKTYQINRMLDYSGEEQHDRFLEGTGSLVFDHTHRKVYACISPRTDGPLVEKIASELGYKAILFQALDAQSVPIYHTNVMMCLGTRFCVICLEAIPESDIDYVLDSLNEDELQIIAISFDQMAGFAGNMLQVENIHGEPYLLMSQSAFERLIPGQINAIGEFAEPLPLSISTIEKVGGGSVRCMVAGIHLPLRQ